MRLGLGLKAVRLWYVTGTSAAETALYVVDTRVEADLLAERPQKDE